MRNLNIRLANPRDWRVGVKLAVIMTLLALLPLAFAIVQSDTRIRGELLAAKRADLQRAARDTATRIDGRVQERRRQFQVFAASPIFSRFAEPETREQAVEDLVASLEALVRNEPMVETAFLTDPRGEVLAGRGSLAAGLVDKTFFKTTLQGSPSVSGVETIADGRRGLNYTVPLRDAKGVVSSILVVQIRTDDFDTIIDADRGRLGIGSFGTLADRGGQRVSGGLGGAADPEITRRMIDLSFNNQYRTDTPSGPVLFGAQPLGTDTWVYTIQQPESVALAALDESTRFSATIFLFAALTVLGVSFALAGFVERPLRDLQRVATAIRYGDYSARARVRGGDELGQVAASLNQMLDEVTQLIQSREERDRIQQQIITLLSEVSTAAEGDLTIEAQVTEGALGSVADAFNYMLGELRTIIANVNDTTVKVSSSTGEILEASRLLVRSAGTQAEQIAAASRAIDEMSASISRVSENARLSAQVSQEARENARLGLESVRATIQGMQRIRAQQQGTAKQIKRLGESSQEIGQIVQLIQEMADQTNLLALNAAIQASMAGEHGRGFAVVADEVRRLAERAASATKQISLLVNTIQSETTQAVIAMENNTLEVVEGSRLADGTGQSLETIDAVVRRLAELSGAISEAAEQQAEVSRAIARSMSEISEVTQTTSVGSQQTAESVGYLARLAEQLRASVATFRLSKSEA